MLTVSHTTRSTRPSSASLCMWRTSRSETPWTSPWVGSSEDGSRLTGALVTTGAMAAAYVKTCHQRTCLLVSRTHTCSTCTTTNDQNVHTTRLTRPSRKSSVLVGIVPARGRSCGRGGTTKTYASTNDDEKTPRPTMASRRPSRSVAANVPRPPNKLASIVSTQKTSTVSR